VHRLAAAPDGHHHRRPGARCTGGHLREETHALAEWSRFDLEEGAGVARLPVLEGILLDLVDDGAAELASHDRNVVRPVASDLEGEAVPHEFTEFHKIVHHATIRAIVRHPPVPVATTVHDLQVVGSVPRDPTDQPLSVIATPTHAIRIKRPSAAPTGIDWTRLSAKDLEEMPILAELKRMTTSNA
jgi:hypothetical protein